MRKLWIALSTIIAAVAPSCSSTSTNSGKLACAPGDSKQCVALSGCSGVQVCNNKGTGYNACACFDGGAGKSGGTAGSGGSTTGGSGGGGSGGAGGGGSGDGSGQTGDASSDAQSGCTIDSTTLAQCSAAAPTVCGQAAAACVCQACTCEMLECEADAACVAIINCVMQKGCASSACYQAGVCQTVIDAYGGPTTHSASLATYLGGCGTNSGCPVGCAEDASND